MTDFEDSTPKTTQLVFQKMLQAQQNKKPAVNPEHEEEERLEANYEKILKDAEIHAAQPLEQDTGAELSPEEEEALRLKEETEILKTLDAPQEMAHEREELNTDRTTAVVNVVHQPEVMHSMKVDRFRLLSAEQVSRMITNIDKQKLLRYNATRPDTRVEQSEKIAELSPVQADISKMGKFVQACVEHHGLDNALSLARQQNTDAIAEHTENEVKQIEREASHRMGTQLLFRTGEDGSRAIDLGNHRRRIAEQYNLTLAA